MGETMTGTADAQETYQPVTMITRQVLPEEASAASPGGHQATTVAVASALRDLRNSLAEPDCRDIQEILHRAIFARGREFAETIGTEPYGGMVVFEDEGHLELVIEAVRGQGRRLSVTVRPEDLFCKVVRITVDAVIPFPWTRRVYDLAGHVDWLLGRTDA
jgi:hypothetical protein